MRIITPQEIEPTVRIVNYFQALKGSAWGPRTLMDLEIILVADGELRYAWEGQEVRVGAGDVLCIFPRLEHCLWHRPEGPRAVISCIHCDLLPAGSYGRDYMLEPAPPVVTHTPEDPVVGDAFRRAADLYEGYGRYRAALVASTVREIWLRLAERWAGSPMRGRTPRMRQMIRYLRNNLFKPISRRDVAEAFALTPEHVNALFRKELGVTPTEFIHRERVLVARRLLRQEGLSVKEAAYRVGFTDPYYFSKVFRKVTGVPPSRAR